MDQMDAYKAYKKYKGKYKRLQQGGLGCPMKITSGCVERFGSTNKCCRNHVMNSNRWNCWERCANLSIRQDPAAAKRDCDKCLDRACLTCWDIIPRRPTKRG